MFALYFNDSDGGRAFIAAVDDKHSAMSMAKLLSRQDPRDVVVIENRPTGDTMLMGTFRRGGWRVEDSPAAGMPAGAMRAGETDNAVDKQ
ncbi:MAG: hypothetical protein AB7E79_15500 [Rhodospirillaceae bacterium]